MTPYHFDRRPDLPPPAPSHCAMANGLWTGLAMAALCVCWLLSPMNSALAYPTLILVLFVPALVYIFMLRDAKRAGDRWPFAGVWLDGLLTMICGGVIAALVVFVILRWVMPDYLHEQFASALKMLESLPDPSAKEMATQFKTAASEGALALSPIAFAMSILWLVTLSGSLITLIFAAIVRGIARNAGRNDTPPPPPPAGDL